MQHLDHYDRHLIHIIGNMGDMNTNEAADKTNMSWVTAEKHLKKLQTMKYVVGKRKNKQMVWCIYKDSTILEEKSTAISAKNRRA